MKTKTMKNIFIMGKTGVGKTFTAKKLLNQAKENYHNIKHRYHSLVSKEMLYKFYFIPRILLESQNVRRAIEIVDEAVLAEVIVLDDLGVNKLNNFNPDLIYIIINERLEKGKSTIVTSNLTIQEISEMIDDRLASRISSFDIILLQGEDKRKRKF